MSIEVLTIRNITSVTLTLKSAEQLVPTLPTENSTFWARNVTQWRFNSSTSTTTSLPASITTDNVINCSDLDIAVEPFTTVQTSLKLSHLAQLVSLSLTFEACGERYTIDIPLHHGHTSQTLTPASLQAKEQFIGIFLPECAFLAIFGAVTLHCWMKYLGGGTPLSRLSIPGTHNSATCYRALPSVRCQAVSPQDQLENGVRFFDVRVQPESSTSSRLVLVHGAFPVSISGKKYFRALLDVIFEFLDRNPSEVLIMSVKREGTGEWDGEQLSRILFDHYITPHKHRWYTSPSVPSLSEVRGKIVLMRRFGMSDDVRARHSEGSWGIDAECWSDNTSAQVYGNICVQDFYEVLETVNIEEKLDFCRAQLERAASCAASKLTYANPPFHLNFLSASNFWKVGCWPHRIAAKVNPAITTWLCTNHAQSAASGGATGVVICDWVGLGGDWTLVKTIVGFNRMLSQRGMES